VPPRIFVDTNVLVSGLLYRGNESRVLELAIDRKIKLVLSKQVIEEAKRTLVEKFQLEAPLSDAVVERWSKLAEIVEVPRDEDHKLRGLVSREDAPILAAAAKSRAECLLTGDRDFHREDVKRFIDVMTAKQFLEKAGWL